MPGFSNLVLNSLFSISRQQLASIMLDGPHRDIDKACGYPADITPEQYQRMYDREGAAARVVDIYPQETWSIDPEIYEQEDAAETQFETAWKELLQRLDLFHYLERVDVLSGIGRFGILLLGLDDGKPLDQPVEGINNRGEKTGSAAHQLLYVRPFAEFAVRINSCESDKGNPRYGQPTMYDVTLADPAALGAAVVDSQSTKVHWSRVIHVADNRKSSEIYGTPRMQTVWNRLHDLRKELGASGEGYWRGGVTGHMFNVDPTIAADFSEEDKTKFRDEIEEWANGLKRDLAMRGVTPHSLAPEVADPTPHVDTQLRVIAFSIGVPWRIFMGSEQGQLAADEDVKTWRSHRIPRRQSKYVTPLVIRPLVDRLVAVGVLPEPQEVHVDWPDLAAPSDRERAEVAVKITEAIAKYVAGNLDAFVEFHAWLTLVMGFTAEEADALVTPVVERLRQEETPPAAMEQDGNGQTTDTGAAAA